VANYMTWEAELKFVNGDGTAKALGEFWLAPGTILELLQQAVSNSVATRDFHESPDVVTVDTYMQICKIPCNESSIPFFTQWPPPFPRAYAPFPITHCTRPPARAPFHWRYFA
jgi:hypothetical protein